jgi:hypothetical protein
MREQYRQMRSMVWSAVLVQLKGRALAFQIGGIPLTWHAYPATRPTAPSPPGQGREEAG